MVRWPMETGMTECVDEEITDGIPTKHKGAANELRAVLWLMKQGYEVFRNVSQHGAIDIIATRNDEILFLDVKSSWARPTGRITATNEQIQRNVKLLLVCANDTFKIVDPVIPEIIVCVSCVTPLKMTIDKRRRYCSKTCKNRVSMVRYHAAKSEAME